jgi:hypothetical protein
VSHAPPWLLLIHFVLLLAVVVATARPGLALARSIRWHPAALGLALAAPLLLAAWLPQSEYHFAGHEGAYGELLDGGWPAEDLASHRIFPVPSSVAAVVGRVLPPDVGRSLWLILNRGSLSLVLLGVGWAAGLLAVRRGQESERATLLAVLGALSVAPLLGWSATAFAIVPAVSAGSLSLAFGIARRPAACLAWGALALGTRMESSVLLLAGALAAWPSIRAALSVRKAALAGAIAVFVIEAVSLAGKRAELPLESTAPDGLVLLENLRCLALGGSWFTLWAVAGLVGLIVARRADLSSAWPLLAGLAIALIQPLGLVDVGARHLIPAALLICVLVAGLSPGDRGLFWALALLAPALMYGVVGVEQLGHRYAAGPDAHLPSWVAAADTGKKGPLSALVDPDCYLVLPGGEEDHPGAASTGDVREIHNAALELAAGSCVQWAVHTGAEFVGDTAAERFDRARLVLGLKPAGWVERGDGARWMLWEARAASESR